MAGKSIGSTLLGWLNSLFKSISSPISGFDVADVKAKEDGDNFSSLFQFEANSSTFKNSQTGQLEELTDERSGKAITDANGNKIELNVLLKTLNAQEVLDPIMSGMNNLGTDDYADRKDLLNVLLGSDRTDNSVAGASNTSLLGMDVSKDIDKIGVDFDGQTWSWGHIMDRLSFALECESPGKDFGAIEGKGLEDCGRLIGEYLTKVGITQSIEEVQVSWKTLVLPILTLMQTMLIDYFNKVVNEYGIAQDAEPLTDEDEIMDQIDNAFGEGDIGSSRHIDVTLQRITGTTEFKLTAIKANYNYSDVLNDIDEIINQEEFIDTLPEEPTSYSIDVDDEGFDISECDECIECNPCESLCEVFKAGIRAYRNLYIIHWLSYGNDMMKLHLLAEEMYEELIKEIDTLGELLVEKQGTVPQLDFPCDYLPIQNYDFQSGIMQIQSLIYMYIDCIDYAYCNQDSDVQSILDEWLRYWKKQTNYFVKRQEI